MIVFHSHAATLRAENLRLRRAGLALVAAVGLLAAALVFVGVRSVRALTTCEAPIVITANPGQAI